MLLDALNAGEDRAKWDASGAEPFIKGLLSLLSDPAPPLAQHEDAPTPEPEVAAEPTPLTAPAEGVRPARVAPQAKGARRSSRPPARVAQPGLA